jgi:hypothetical protein
MSDSDSGHSRNHITLELTQDESEDPAPRHLRFATDDVNGRRSIRA